MLGILFILAASWAILAITKREPITVLGLLLTKRRLSDFAIGFIATIVGCSIYFGLITLLSKSNWTVNPDFTALNWLKSTAWVFRSVLTEELIFRGVLFYLVLEKWGIRTACWLSALLFGLMHVFNYGLSNPIQIVYIILITASAGWGFAYAFAKTRSLYMPLGLHFGWNFDNIIVFSQGPLGKQFLESKDGETIGNFGMLILFLFQIIIFPLIVVAYAKFIERKK